VVLSGARLAAQTPPYELYTFNDRPRLRTFSANYQFRRRVRASGDLNGDGVGEILAARRTTSSVLRVRDEASCGIYSGATGVLLTTVLERATIASATRSTGALQDLDGDNFKRVHRRRLAVRRGGTDSGVVKCYRLFPLSPTTYCTGKVNSLVARPRLHRAATEREFRRAVLDQRD